MFIRQVWESCHMKKNVKLSNTTNVYCCESDDDAKSLDWSIQRTNGDSGLRMPLACLLNYLFGQRTGAK